MYNSPAALPCKFEQVTELPFQFCAVVKFVQYFYNTLLCQITYHSLNNLDRVNEQ